MAQDANAGIPESETPELPAEEERAKTITEGLPDSPVVFRGDRDLVSRADPDLESAKLAVKIMARAARDHFTSACESLEMGNLEDAESEFFASRDFIDDIWEHAFVRSQPFRDLVAVLDAAIRHTEITKFDSVQTAVLQTAFAKLCKNFLDADEVTETIVSCAEHSINIAAPINPGGKEQFRIRIEPIP